jgi:hypothetical protein
MARLNGVGSLRGIGISRDRGRVGGRGVRGSNSYRGGVDHGSSDNATRVSIDGDLRLDLATSRDARDDRNGPEEDEAEDEKNHASSGEVITLAAT